MKKKGLTHKKGAKHGIESTGDKYFPESPITHRYKQPSEIGKYPYPDTPEAIIAEQQGSIERANKNAYRTKAGK